MIRIILLPFAALYNFITAIRNRLYDLGLKPSVQFNIPVINVGNLAVGGTGKTPMIEHLIRKFHQNYSVATLSRGYGRKTKGLRIANTSDNASTIGDEPFQFYSKFQNYITVAVGEDRPYAISNILHQYPETQLVLLDDAYQHRRVRPSLNILLTDYNRPFYEDYLLPAGRLRESRQGAQRADVVVVTKCPAEISDDEMIIIAKAIRIYTNSPVFFTKIRYGAPVCFGASIQDLNGYNQVILVSGIANHKPLLEYVQRNFKLVKDIAYPDHHEYSIADIRGLSDLIKTNPEASILVTEKDMVKIAASTFKDITAQLPLFYLPIEVEFIKNGKDFDEMVLAILNHGIDN